MINAKWLAQNRFRKMIDITGLIEFVSAHASYHVSNTHRVPKRYKTLLLLNLHCNPMNVVPLKNPHFTKKKVKPEAGCLT